MKYLIVALIVIILLLLITISIIFFIKIRMKKILKDYFNTSNLKDALEISGIESDDAPKSLSSMDTIYLNKLKNDFPELNVNELKRSCEHIIIDSLKAIEKKDEKFLLESNKINSYIKSQITNNDVKFNDIKIHKTVVNKYEKNDKIATLYFASSVEYFYKKNNEIGKKVQTRFLCEYIYIIDSEKLGNIKSLGLNCPNCGAPIKKLEHKYCEYCNTGIIDVVKRSWIINNIKEY